MSEVLQRRIRLVSSSLPSTRERMQRTASGLAVKVTSANNSIERQRRALMKRTCKRPCHCAHHESWPNPNLTPPALVPNLIVPSFTAPHCHHSLPSYRNLHSLRHNFCLTPSALAVIRTLCSLAHACILQQARRGCQDFFENFDLLVSVY